MPMIIRKNPKEQFFGETEYSETGCFGNEASDTSFYVKAALIVDIPAYDKRNSTKISANEEK